MHSLRRLGYDLVELPEHRRRAIAIECGLFDVSMVTPRVGALIQRAIDSGKIKTLQASVLKAKVELYD